MTTSEPPPNTTIFAFTPFLRWLMIGCFVVFCGFTAFGLGLVLVGRGTQNLVIGAICIVEFGSFAMMTLYTVRRLRDRVAVSDEGIWYLPRQGAPTFIRWDEVGSVEAHDLIRRLVITDYAGFKRINLEYQLDRFDELRNFVLGRTARQRRGKVASSVFHRSYLNRGVLLFGIFMWAVLATWAAHVGSLGSATGFVAFAIFTVYVLAREPSRVIVSANSIDIDYLGWRRSVPFDSVTNIEIDNLPSGRGDVSAAVFIDAATGRPLRLAGFREGSVALYDALRAGWDVARGVNPTPPTQSEATDAALQGSSAVSPSALPATFHTGIGAWFGLLAPVLASAGLVIGLQLYQARPHGAHGLDLIALWCALVTAQVLFVLIRVPRRITISNDGVAMEYVLWSRVVGFKAIAKIELTKALDLRGGRSSIVRVQLSNGKVLRLAGMREGAPALYQVLRPAWENGANRAAMQTESVPNYQGSSPPAAHPEFTTQVAHLAPRFPVWFAPAVVTIIALAVVMTWPGMTRRLPIPWLSRSVPDLKALAGFAQPRTGWSGAPQPLFPGEPRSNRWNVDYSSGVFTHNQTDFYIGDSIPINLTRVFLKSYDEGAFGSGTSASYDTFLTGDAVRFTYLELTIPDGEQFHFKRISPGHSWSGSVFSCSAKCAGARRTFAGSTLWWNGNGWSLRLTDGTLMKFPSVEGQTRPGQGALLSIEDGHGAMLTIRRDREGNILEIISPHHAIVTVEHDGDNRITRATDSFGKTIVYSYDDNGRLVAVNDSREGVTRYSYDGANRMVEIVKPGGAVWLRIKYDENGRVASLTFEDGSYCRYAYKTGAQGLIVAVDVIPSNGPARHLEVGGKSG